MLTTETPLVDLGVVKFGQVYKFSYKITNTGTEPIDITKLAVGCTSCTVATIRKKNIYPNQSEEVSVTFTPGSVKVHNKWVDVIYDNKTLRLNFTADARK